MRIALATTGLLALLAAGCSGSPADNAAAGGELTTYDVQDSLPDVVASNAQAPERSLAPAAPPPPIGSDDVPPPPHITPESAPDVAFGYLYSFGLAPDRIGPVQQRHASLCEELGPERCRVTGMNYRRQHETRVTADLSLALEPGLAHRFGERALEEVREAEGKLVDSKVSGTDVGTGIRASTRTIAQLEEELTEIEARIARGGSVGTLRDLRAEAVSLRQRIEALRTDRSGKREELATTNMTLSYSSTGYSVGTPDFGGAVATAWNQMKWITYGLFMILMVLLPWLLALGLIILIVRALRRRGARDEAPEAATSA